MSGEPWSPLDEAGQRHLDAQQERTSKPLAAREREHAATGYRCFHCGEVFSGQAAAEHFGPEEAALPTECQQLTSDKHMMDAIVLEFERHGLHRNRHNAASVHLLVEMVRKEILDAGLR